MGDVIRLQPAQQSVTGKIGDDLDFARQCLEEDTLGWMRDQVSDDELALREADFDA